LNVFFLFQAEDGIRDRNVTGVQTCALPICKLMQQFCPKTSYQEEKLPDGTTHLVFKLKEQNNQPIPDNIAVAKQFYGCFNRALRSEERRVGKESKRRERRDRRVGKEQQGQC